MRYNRQDAMEQAPAPPADQRLQKMHALLDQWAAEILQHPVGCLELHFSWDQVKGALKISLGQKKS